MSCDLTYSGVSVQYLTIMKVSSQNLSW